MMSADGLIDEYVPKFNNDGEKKFYHSLIFLALNKLVLIDSGMYKGTPPHIEYLNYSNKFLFLYRREGDGIYLEISKMLRKAAHKIYRIMQKKNMVGLDTKFLNLV